MSRRLRKAIEEFVRRSGPNSDYVGVADAWTAARDDLEFALTGDPLEPLPVERLVAAVDVQIRRGLLDARSAISDARLDLGTPMSEEEAFEVLAEPRIRINRWRADAAFLRDSGLLFEINRRVLHPLGLAIGVEVDDRTDETLRISPSLVRTDDPGGITFSDVDLELGFDALRTFMKSDGYPKLAARYDAKGFRSQVPEDVDPRADEPDWTLASRELVRDAREVIQVVRDVLVHFDHPKYFITVENGRISEDVAARLNDAISEIKEDSDYDVDERVNELCRELSVDDLRVVARRVSAEPDLDELREALKRYDWTHDGAMREDPERVEENTDRGFAFETVLNVSSNPIRSDILRKDDMSDEAIEAMSNIHNDVVESAEALLDEIDDEEDDASEYAELVQTLRNALWRLRTAKSAESPGPTPDPAEVAEVERAISTGFVPPDRATLRCYVEAIETEYNVFARRFDGELVVRRVDPETGEVGDPLTLTYRRSVGLDGHPSESDAAREIETIRRAIESGTPPPVLDLEVERDGDGLRLVRIVWENLADD